jgi:hypothetical protein
MKMSENKANGTTCICVHLPQKDYGKIDDYVHSGQWVRTLKI